MNDLALYNNNLPASMDDLTRFVLLGREKLVAVRAEIRAIEKLKLADEVRAQKIEEAQYIAEAVLDAEVRVGELLKTVPKASGGDRKSNNFKSSSADTFENDTPKQQTQSEIGINKQKAARFMKLAENPAIVETAKATARDNEDIVSRTLVLEMIKNAEREETRKTIQIVEPKPLNGRFDVIYADPPWSYNFGYFDRSTENHYPAMPLHDIKSLEIPTEENSVLYLWATAPKLLEALEVMSAWGFTYRSQMVWDKEIIGMGYWTRGQHETLLIGTKGSFSPPPPDLRVGSVYKERRSEHSKKPNYYCDLIERMFPNGRYLELFARRKYNDKWAVWGNQVE